MDEKKLKNLYSLLKDFALYGGHYALRFYGKVPYEFKEEMLNGQVHKTYLTPIDTYVQKELLSRLLEKGFYDLAFNGEEDTPLKGLMKGVLGKNWAVHCDPIDGTESFVKGKGFFATGCAVSDLNNDFVMTAIYSPLEEKLYCASPWEKTEFEKKKEPSREIYVSKKVLNDEGRKEAEKRGFVFKQIDSTHIWISKIALGELGAMVLNKTNVHDGLVPYAFAKAYGVDAYDNLGNVFDKSKLVVKDGKYERMSRIGYFASDEIRNELVDILKRDEFRVK